MEMVGRLSGVAFGGWVGAEVGLWFAGGGAFSSVDYA